MVTLDGVYHTIQTHQGIKTIFTFWVVFEAIQDIGPDPWIQMDALSLCPTKQRFSEGKPILMTALTL
jgi:hypothetical protein